MHINFIITDDIREAKEKGGMVKIKCGFCKGGAIGNHISAIRDHIKKRYPLHDCVNCGAETELHPEAVSEIKSILGIDG